MPFFQPKVSPLPSNLNLQGQTAVITGASAGLGLETARQLLILNCKTVVLAVRNQAKGEACAAQLARDLNLDPATQTIKVLTLDVSSTTSITSFATTLQQTVSQTNILILNAGISHFKYALSSTGHENALQVNYLANALLLATLLPYLSSSATITVPTRVTWLGSRLHESMTSFAARPPPSTTPVLAYMDAPKSPLGMSRYADTKLLCAMFMYTLAPRLDPRRIVLNMVCPGMVATTISDFLPLYLRALVDVVKAVRARPVEVGARLVVHAAVVAGPETHGRFLGDKEVLEVSKYIQSEAGREIQARLWAETVAEMETLVELPKEFK
ncbi:Short-chain dehydrogenase/reductase SDR [Penicillium macrosclerotiorum]|uniref:Short-chain dehydrogenase/reductase SDR n=1 Tax=Penicillium macrosclerotiorum TaxID=303699 RepID=UPI002547B723|nr:Short-chain dehydrogenase/reductase SDR [Penicillium macrosclerotiorum]KAJ5693139.1 Short-chain dehydrogenase/reductase SDR [Penicillium macrosclerotiorum]